MENKDFRNENFPVIAIKAIGDEYGLVSIVGPELMFQRLGEFLACMMEQTGFYVTKVDKDDKVDSTSLVEMEPYDKDDQDIIDELRKTDGDEAADLYAECCKVSYGQDTEYNKEDLDQDSSDID